MFSLFFERGLKTRLASMLAFNVVLPRLRQTFANALRAGSLKPAPEVAEKLSQFLEDLGQSGEKAEPLRRNEVAHLA
jgi:hypothetical protein